MINKYNVNFFWDDEAEVWIATSDDNDIRGLVLEADTFEGLVHEVQLAIPFLLELNNIKSEGLTLDIFAHRQKRLA
jgi:hypothetical protein